MFAERVRDLFRRGLPPHPAGICEAIEASLRHVYPQVRTAIRADLAGFGDTLIYVYRDGSVTASLTADDWTVARLNSVLVAPSGYQPAAA